jgi:peptide/nickel transport system permease protein
VQSRRAGRRLAITPMATTESTGTEFTSDLGSLAGEAQAPPGIGPYRLAGRRLRRNKVALFFGALFLAIVIICLLAPVYAKHIAHTGPNANHLTDQIKVGGKLKDVVSPAGIPTGPTWHGRFFLGADSNGRDVAVRLLYGGRNSLEIGGIATLITMTLATILGTAAGFFRGWVDAILSRVFDLLWAYPVYILGVALGVSLALGGLNLGLFHLQGNSLGVPAVIIGVIYVPYVGKPIRGQVLGLRSREFVDAARALGLGNTRIMVSEILPNLASTIIVFIPLIIANSILTEAGLSYLGAGVQPPSPSWGTMISDGIRLIPSAIHLTLVPGIMLVLCVLGVNIFGDGVRDALDPRAKVRIEH